ncbi:MULTISPECIES: hypothetical protein [unclassified Streptomyces]|uniref:hypothetical protein n=1 Tax=unclassified Streptomyces TaxID=2593676 RepID=UPI002DD7EF6B|nr:hypothetical protein [Streptomyces sp. NBC_01768]WSC32337.1 hypothetical protein OG902_39765 [Streptomyces sp. NBC_01768]WSX06383.1 hypothetical protein OG355_41405 [Streptomyces sp. NBC_00987]
MTTPYERLTAEQIPTRPTPPPKRDRPDLPGWWTPDEQAQHVADLLSAVSGWRFKEPDPEETPSLRLVTDQTDVA